MLNGYKYIPWKRIQSSLYNYLLLNFQLVSNYLPQKVFIKIGMTKTSVLFFLEQQFRNEITDQKIHQTLKSTHEAEH